MSIRIITTKEPTTNTGRVGFRTIKDASLSAGVLASEKLEISNTKTRLLAMQDMYSLIDKHGYLRAAISVIGRSSVGAWWKLVEEDEGGSPRELHRKKLYKFFAEPPGEWKNINEFYNMAYKLIIGSMYLKLFGQVGFHIVRDKQGNPVSMNHIPAFLVPQVDQFGNFKKPAFIAYRVDGVGDPIEYPDQNDLVYIINPDFGGSPMGSSDLVALADFTFPIDIYLQTLARSYLQNNTRPELIYQLPETISEENFQEFVEEVTARWRGPTNAGRTPIVVQGEFKVHKLGDLPDALPYNESRSTARDEEFAVTGVSGAKVGLTEKVSASGMKEIRREFHESVMEPLFRMIEEAFYWQICVRTFGFRDWRFQFNSPDFLTALEKATVHMRYYQSNSITPNEIRDDLGYQDRPEGGDLFLDELNNADIPADGPQEPQGSPPEGREDDPDSDTPPDDDFDSDPERGDDHDTRVREMVDEVRRWNRFARNRLGATNARTFNPEVLDLHTAKIIQTQLDIANTREEIDNVFNTVLEVIGEIDG